jgi:hypothetical protein
MIMTKINRQESAKAMYYASMGYFDLAARTISASIRATNGQKERNELFTIAANYPAIVQHPEFIAS